MSEKRLPIAEQKLNELLKKIDTPFYIYDADAIKENATRLYDAFSWAPGFTDFFAVKALPNIHILRFLSSIGFGADASSLPELLLSKDAGISSDRIVFTSNDTDAKEFYEAIRMGVILNLDDESHIDRVLETGLPFPKTICFRYNPGSERTGNAIIGNPVEAKYGVTKDQIIGCYERAAKLGATNFGLHTMVASNELDESYIVETARMVFSLVKKIRDEAKVRISFVDLGGGVGIPYRPEDEAIDFYSLSSRIHELYDQMIVNEDLHPLRITFEMGRAITGPYGYLVSRVRHVSHKYKDFVGLDASMADLMRPALYGAYHHITVLGKENKPKDHVYDVTGSLCENNDKFAIDRSLPKIDRGDVFVIHDAGAHSHSMGFNYNAKLRHAEYMILNKRIYKIRRDETYSDYISTMLPDMEEIDGIRL